MPITLPIFNPPDEEVPHIFAHLESPFASLYDVAASSKTSIPALSAWLMREDVQQLRHTTDCAAASRARSLALSSLHNAVNFLDQLIDNAIEEERNGPDLKRAPDPIASKAERLHLAKAPLIRLRTRETARKAAELLLIIARVKPLPADAISAGNSPPQDNKTRRLATSAAVEVQPRAQLQAPDTNDAPRPAPKLAQTPSPSPLRALSASARNSPSVEHTELHAEAQSTQQEVFAAHTCQVNIKSHRVSGVQSIMSRSGRASPGPAP